MGASPQIGRVFEHYRLLEKLGEGGMGVVWLAEDTRLGRKVALKFLPPEAARDTIRRQRFEQEARAAAALSHPGIATVHELAGTEGQTYIVFEYVPGNTLRSLVVSGGLPCDELLDIAGDIADALAAAHAAGVVHRDLKPENVMRTPAGDCKVMDFGLARLSAQAAPDSATQNHLTRSGMVVGTVGYMAPEQLEGKEVDFRSDIFSFGSLLYELATGVHPFQRGNSASTIAAILTAEPPPLTLRNPLQPAELERIVRKCLRKRRNERYQSTRDLAVDLRNLKHDSDEGPSSVAAVEATVPSSDDSLLRAVFSRFRATPRRWWELHQLFVIFVYCPVALRLATGYSAMVSAAYGTALASNWHGIGGLVRAVASPEDLPTVWRSAGLALFVTIVLLLITSAVLRFYFIILAVVVPERLLFEIRRLGRLRTGADIVVGCEFMFLGLGFVLRFNIVEGAALAAFGLMILLAVVYVEPAMVRAAFPQAFAEQMTGERAKSKKDRN